MDTTFVSIIDTVKMVPVSSWWKNPAWFTAITALAGIFISIIVFLYTKRLNDLNKRAELNTCWVDLTPQRLVFWGALDDSYKIWLQVGQKNMPSLGDLVSRAGPPKDLDRFEEFKKNIDYRNRLSTITKDTNSDQKWMLDFADGIFCWGGGRNNSILPDGPEPGFRHGYNEFNNACSALTHALNGWAETMPMKYLSRRFKGDYILILTLVWLEISLIKRLGSRWSDRSYLFKLAIAIEKTME